MTELRLRRLFVANRGEIARRIFRTARRLGVDTATGYSDADLAQPFVREAGAAVRLGPAAARESYMDAEGVLAAARSLGCDALHPGYGFLSENAEFAEAVVRSGLVWVGPPPAAIRAMGRKDAAKSLMAASGVPVTPGYLGEDQSEARLKAEADQIGYPVLIKAVAGGGGKGMRKVTDPDRFLEALAAARREAEASFGDGRVILEMFVRRPRHIEVQVFADQGGETVHLFERDCSLQRRHQKVIEEAPAPGLSAAARSAATSAAVSAARAVGYVGAGTVEFIADASEGLRPDRIWFMEMNTRLQVEHPVTEALTGLDLVEWQLRIADGQPLPLRQEEICRSGSAIEARLYAEAPARGFLPSTGPLLRCRLPDPAPPIRVDAGVEEGGEVTADYDPMIAKIIAHAPTRRGAALALARACRSVEIWPVSTNAGFLARCLESEAFLEGEAETGFIETHISELTPTPPPSRLALSAAAEALSEARPGPPGPFSPRGELAGFRLNASPERTTSVRVGGALLEAELSGRGDRSVLRLADGAVVVFEGGEAFRVEGLDASIEEDEASGGSDGRLRAPMPGRIVSLAAVPGALVKKGDPILSLEAMKMEHVLAAPFDAAVAEVAAALGEQVAEGVVLARLERL